MLALLLVEASRIVSMGRLAQDVRGGHPPDGWTTLQTYVFHLRRALELARSAGGGVHGRTAAARVVILA